MVKHRDQLRRARREDERNIQPVQLLRDPDGRITGKKVEVEGRNIGKLVGRVDPNVPDARTPRRIVQTGCSSTNLKKIAPQAWRITFIAFSRAAFAKTS